eukprot:GHVT01002807.1.p2 GENE.GHVT01002807.1~~GHVT01002807.1.p2  ORF type:complete len:101 (+),score=4.22 GHVT01002807.1:130-432(+)
MHSATEAFDQARNSDVGDLVVITLRALLRRGFIASLLLFCGLQFRSSSSIDVCPELQHGAVPQLYVHLCGRHPHHASGQVPDLRTSADGSRCRKRRLVCT